MAVPAAGQEAPVTDMATGLGGTASCPSCGAQVEVVQRAGAAIIVLLAVQAVGDVGDLAA